jgi:hypothetical protein
LSVTLREEHRLRLLGDTKLKVKFGPSREERQLPGLYPLLGHCVEEDEGLGRVRGTRGDLKRKAAGKHEASDNLEHAVVNGSIILN